jgi:hypothetical protein
METNRAKVYLTAGWGILGFPVAKERPTDASARGPVMLGA